jgi:hypothetical protein
VLRNVPSKKEGVIATIVGCISKDAGASRKEILAALIRKFSERDPEQMANTIGTQLSRHATSKKDDEKRGRVYFRRGKGAVT